MARQRIVINLDAPKGGPAPGGRGKSRRWPKVLGILAGLVLFILVIAAVGGFLWWRRYQATPTYTLALILDAAQRNDNVEFQKRVDHEEIAKNMVATLSEKAAGRYGLSLSGSAQQRVESVMPALLPRITQTVHDEIWNMMKRFAAAPEQRSFTTILGAVPSLMTVTTEGDIAKATGSMAGHKIELTMRRDAERWKVTEYKDDIVVQRIVDSVMKELPAIESPADSPLLKKLSRRRPRNR